MSSIQAGLQAIAQEPANQPIITRFVRFAAALAVFPVLAYFLVRYLITYFDFPETGLFSSPILSGLAAVLTVNIIISSFALLALKEPSQPLRSALSVAQSESEQQQQESTSSQSKTEREKTE